MGPGIGRIALAIALVGSLATAVLQVTGAWIAAAVEIAAVFCLYFLEHFLVTIISAAQKE